MRKVEETIYTAVMHGLNRTCGNTSVVEGSVYLHGNCISKVLPSGERVYSLAGWNTNTTRSRLRALGFCVYQKNYTPMLNGKEINPCAFYNEKGEKR